MLTRHGDAPDAERRGPRWVNGLLQPDDPDPVLHLRRDSGSPILLVCDHAGNRVPSGLELGVATADLERHIGYDIGALGVAERMSKDLGAELIAQRYSRLVIDCNRPVHSPEAMPVHVDGTDVPGNCALAAPDAAARVAELFHPYHAAIASSLDRRSARGEHTVLVSMHSFTPHRADQPAPRPWQIAFLFRQQAALSHALHKRLASDGFVVGMNEPYQVDDESDVAIPRHAEDRGLLSTLVEIRQDCIATPADQAAWATRLARHLSPAIDHARNVHEGDTETP